MSLRTRMGIAAGVAVALAVIAVAVSAYAGTRGELLGQIDNSLHNLARPILIRAGVEKGPPPGPGGVQGGPGQASGGPGQSRGGPGPAVPGRGGFGPAGGAAGGGSLLSNDCDGGLGLDVSRGGGFGGAQGYVQLVRPNGSICLAGGERTKIPVGSEVTKLAASGSGHFTTDATVGSTHLRVLVYGVGSRVR